MDETVAPRRARRRSRVFVAAGLVVLLGVLLTQALRTPAGYPPNFWVRDGEEPPRAYEGPNGASVLAWEIERRGGDRVLARTRASLPSRLLGELGFGGRGTFAFVTSAVDWSDPCSGWTEYCIGAIDQEEFERGTIDARIADVWKSVTRDRTLEFLQDGTRPRSLPSSLPPLAWRTVGDLVVMPYGDPEGPWLMADAVKFDAARAVLVTRDGEEFRRRE